MNGKIMKIVVLFTLLCTMLFPNLAMAEEKEKVLIIPLEDVVEPGLATYIERNYQLAQEKQVDWIVIEMDTPGGRVDAAQEIKTTIMQSSIPTAVLVKGQAISAGAYIALACDVIAMQPGSTIGDAEMRVNGERADEKYMSAWKEEVGAVAEARGRNPEIAKAFVDRDMEIPGVIEAGKLLTLSPNRALELGMADYVVDGRQQLFTELKLENPVVEEASLTSMEKIARLITHPNVAPILLTIGVVSIILEIFTAGFGVFGAVGLLSMGLYFGGHMLAGLSSWVTVLLFVLGFILFAIEIFMPGFGVFGILGSISMAASIFMLSPDLETAIRSMVYVLVGSIVIIPIALKFMQKRNFWDKISINKTLTTEDGYTSRPKNHEQYIGQEGVAVTVLRPSGAIELSDGTRLDVVTRGEYIESGTKVTVVGIDGTWLVVRKTVER